MLAGFTKSAHQTFLWRGTHHRPAYRFSVCGLLLRGCVIDSLANSLSDKGDDAVVAGFGTGHQLFNTFGLRQEVVGEGFTNRYENYYETQVIRLGATWKF
jgi:hypothetical protein